MAINTNNSEIGGKITQALSAGSGVDIHDLAKTLAEAESLPGINSVTAKKEESTVAISGLGILKSSVSSLKTSIDALRNEDQFLDKSVYSQSTDRIEVAITSQAAAEAGTTQVKVNTLARSETSTLKRYTGSGSASEEFTSLTQQLNGGSTINFSIVVGSTTTALNGATDTPQGIMDAVNAVTSTTGVSARALKTLASGTAFTILLEGKTGAANAFSFSGHQTANTSNQLKLTQERSAADLDVNLNNVENVLRDNNSPADLIPGVQLNFKVATDSTTNIVVSEDATTLQTKLNTFIGSYNDFVRVADYLTGKSDEDDEIAGSLAREKGTVNLIKNRIRSTIGQTSESASNNISTLRDIGIQTTLGGEISLNTTTYASVIQSKFSDVRTMLTGDLNDQDASDTLRDHGLALDISTVLDGLVNDQGAIKAKETSTAAAVASYETQLLDLNERLETIKSRYLTQFIAMETLVQRSKNTGEYLTGQFKAMESMYSSK